MPQTVFRERARRPASVGAFSAAFGLLVLAFIVYGPLTPTRASIGPIEGPSVQPAALQPKQPGANGPRATDRQHRKDDVAIASPGRIEAKSDAIEIGAAMDGVIQSILVQEGQSVARGQVLARLDCRELESALPVAQAEAESLRQVRERLLRGSREEEREAAAERTAAAKAVLAQASSQAERFRKLAESDEISRSSYDEARRDSGVAEAEYQRAMRNEELVNAGPLPEEVAKADADLQAAEKRVNLSQERLGKCVIRAPIDATILRIFLRQGESFALAAPRPVLTMADISGRRVLAEVDERDVGKVHIGQTVTVTSEAYAGQRFTGTVTRLAAIMGRKSVVTGDPADKYDRDILEVTAELEPAATALPVGLRATVQFRP